VIAAVHGIAYGLAVDILSACDIRYASSDAVFSIKEVDIGMASDVGSLARFPKTVGNDSLTREAGFTGRDFRAKEALGAGFLSKIVPGGREEVLQVALKTAEDIASKSPTAILGIKRVLLHARDHSVQENLNYVAVWNMTMLQSPDYSNSIAAFKAKRKAKYMPLLGKL